MSSENYTNQILDAVETLTNKAIETAGYNKTIQATILQKMNESGKYRVQYQDSEMIVYANNTEIDYPEGTLVYVLIPNGDFSLNKIILDIVDKDQANYSVPLNDEDNYINVSGNIVNSLQEFGLCSYNQAGQDDEFDDQILLYDRDASVDNINLNSLLIQDSLFKADSFLCGAKFRTDLKPEQQMQGNYGLIFEIDFNNNIDGALTTKRYILDINSFIGQPYNLSTYTRQYKIFNIDNNSFNSIKKVFLFSNTFPNSASGKPSDIFVQDLEFNLMKQVAENEYIIYLDRDKQYFDANDPAETVINLKATVRLKNKIITDNLIEYYWFKENGSIDTTSDQYLSYGGNGWECLNDYVDNDDKRVYNSNQNLVFAIEQAKTLETRLKCVAVRNEVVFAVGEDTIKNYAAAFTLNIESDEGFNFYYDNGSPTLTCLVNGIEDNTNYDYEWSYIDNNNVLYNLPETTELNTTYNNTVTAYENLLTQVETGLANAAANQAQLAAYLGIIESIGQRVEKNKIYNIDLTKIYNNAIFKCAVIDKITHDIVGTVSVELTNETVIEGNYILEIVNGLQTFHYNENGLAPTHESLDSPIELKPLSFNIYDNNGKKFAQKILDQCDVEWTLPQVNTLISSDDITTNHTFTYTIANLYDENKIYNNNIGLTVKYKDLLLRSTTSFTFTKDGDPGYNGSNIVVKIVPNLSLSDFGNINCYPMVVNGKFNFGILNYENPSQTKWFKLQVWKEGNKVYEGNTNTDGVTELHWTVLRNKYSSSVSDPTNLTINASTGECSWNNTVSPTLSNFNAPANIIQVSFKYENKVYYSAIPIISISSLATGYTVEWERNSGFRNVMYENDNTHPHYSNNIPFTIIVKKNINGYIEDISKVDNDEKVEYRWINLGQFYNGTQCVDRPDFKILNNYPIDWTIDNFKTLKPNDKYIGEVVTNALRIEIRKASNQNAIAVMHIPLYFYLSKFGYPELEGWNGNSMLVDKDGGYILTPQIGAGKYEEETVQGVLKGGFTGLLMGTLRDKNAASGTEKVGLIGLNKGEQAIFLDSKTGKAEFGLSGKSRIVIDPTNNTAELYSGNYVDSATIGEGLKIDLSTPEIRYGNRKFIVNSSGELTASSATISGNITATDGTFTGTVYAKQGSFGNGTKKITIGTSSNGSNSAIYSDSKSSFTANASGFYIGTDGIALGTFNSTTQHSVFEVDTSGNLYANSATIKGTVNATAGYFGNGSNKVSIGNNSTNSYLYYGKNSLTSTNNGFYIGTDGIAFGPYNSTFEKSAFQWDSTTGVSITKGNIELQSDAIRGNRLSITYTKNDGGNSLKGTYAMGAAGDYVDTCRDYNDTSVPEAVDPVPHPIPGTGVWMSNEGYISSNDTWWNTGQASAGARFYCLESHEDILTAHTYTKTPGIAGLYIGGKHRSNYSVTQVRPACEIKVTDFFTGGNVYLKLSADENNASANYVYIDPNSGVIHSSLAEAKKDIELFTEKALDLINNSDIYTYRFKQANENTKKRIGVIIGENYNCCSEIIADTGTGIDLYSMISVVWKGVQELSNKLDKIEKEIKG